MSQTPACDLVWEVMLSKQTKLMGAGQKQTESGRPESSVTLKA